MELGRGQPVTLSVQCSERNLLHLHHLRCVIAGFDGLNRNIPSTRRQGFEASFKGRYNEYFDGSHQLHIYGGHIPIYVQHFRGEDDRAGDTIPLVPRTD